MKTPDLVRLVGESTCRRMACDLHPSEHVVTVSYSSPLFGSVTGRGATEEEADKDAKARVLKKLHAKADEVSESLNRIDAEIIELGGDPEKCSCYHCGDKPRIEQGKPPCEYYNHHCQYCHLDGKCTKAICKQSECSTCGESYSKKMTARAAICSNAFHCCRDCAWVDGQVTTPCAEHAREPNYGIPCGLITPPDAL